MPVSSTGMTEGGVHHSPSPRGSLSFVMAGQRPGHPLQSKQKPPTTTPLPPRGSVGERGAKHRMRTSFRPLACPHPPFGHPLPPQAGEGNHGPALQLFRHGRATTRPSFFHRQECRQPPAPSPKRISPLVMAGQRPGHPFCVQPGSRQPPAPSPSRISPHSSWPGNDPAILFPATKEDARVKHGHDGMWASTTSLLPRGPRPLVMAGQRPGHPFPGHQRRCPCQARA